MNTMYNSLKKAGLSTMETLSTINDLKNDIKVETQPLKPLNYITVLPVDVRKSYIDYSIKYYLNYKVENFELNNDKTVSSALLKINEFQEENKIFFILDYFMNKVANHNKDIITTSNDNIKKGIDFTSNNDILNASLTQLISEGDLTNISYTGFLDSFKDNYHIDIIGETKHAKQNNNECNVIKHYILDKTKNRTVILHDPLLKNNNTLLVDKEMIIIKCVECTNCTNSINDFDEVISLANEYYQKTGIKCDRVTIYNPILGFEKYIDLNY